MSLLTGTAFPDTQMIPYGPIVEMLRPVLLARQASSSVPSEDLAAVSTLIPELRLVYPHLEPPAMVGHDQLRIRLFEALSNCILGLTGGRSVLFCLDDLHWADSTTMEWLIHLGRHLRGSRILVIGTYRREGGKGEQAIDMLRHSLARQGHLYELELAGLHETGILRLLRGLGDPVPAEQTLAQRLGLLRAAILSSF